MKTNEEYKKQLMEVGFTELQALVLLNLIADVRIEASESILTACGVKDEA